MLFLADCASSCKVEPLLCMNMQLLEVRVKDRQGIVAVFKYTLLSSIILTFFSPAYPPPPPYLVTTLHCKLFTSKVVCHLSGALTVVPVAVSRGQSF